MRTPSQKAFYYLQRLLGLLGIQLHGYWFTQQPLRESRAPETSKFQFYMVDTWQPWFSQMPRPEEVLRTRLQQGSKCVAVLSGGRLCGMLWYSEGGYAEDEVRAFYSVEKTQAVWDFDVYVWPEYRMTRVFMYLWQMAAHLLGGSGIRYSFSRVAFTNDASIRSHGQLGAKAIGWAVFFGALGRQVTVCGSGKSVRVRLGTVHFRLEPETVVAE
jgi:hypothetical protein